MHCYIHYCVTLERSQTNSSEVRVVCLIMDSDYTQYHSNVPSGSLVGILKLIKTKKSSCRKPHEAYHPQHNLSGGTPVLAGGGVTPVLARGTPILAEGGGTSVLAGGYTRTEVPPPRQDL